MSPPEKTPSPIQTESASCAPCHFGIFWDATIDNGCGEWLESPYGQEAGGETCQGLHMPARGATRFASVNAGGLERAPTRNRSHRMLGISDESFMQEAAELIAEARWTPGGIPVEAVVTNDHTGHNLPSDSSLRNLILLVQAPDEEVAIASAGGRAVT